MGMSEFRSGLEVFTDRHAQVQQRLSDIEKRDMVHRNMDQYRRLLDELIEIGLERAHYCSKWHQKQLPG